MQYKKFIKERLYEFDMKSKDFFSTNIEQETIKNDSFRKVLYTSENIQLVLMSLDINENIGFEIHENDQFFRIEKGNGVFFVEDKIIRISDGSCVIVPKGTKHDVKNTGNTILKFYTIYSPPHHPKNLEHTFNPDI